MLQLFATPTLLFCNRRCTDSWPPRDITNFKFDLGMTQQKDRLLELICNTTERHVARINM